MSKCVTAVVSKPVQSMMFSIVAASQKEVCDMKHSIKNTEQAVAVVIGKVDALTDMVSGMGATMISMDAKMDDLRASQQAQQASQQAFQLAIADFASKSASQNDDLACRVIAASDAGVKSTDSKLGAIQELFEAYMTSSKDERHKELIALTASLPLVKPSLRLCMISLIKRTPGKLPKLSAANIRHFLVNLPNTNGRWDFGSKFNGREWVANVTITEEQYAESVGYYLKKRPDLMGKMCTFDEALAVRKFHTENLNSSRVTPSYARPPAGGRGASGGGAASGGDHTVI